MNLCYVLPFFGLHKVHLIIYSIQIISPNSASSFSQKRMHILSITAAFTRQPVALMLFIPTEHCRCVRLGMVTLQRQCSASKCFSCFPVFMKR